jgi:hypothetical protein
MNAHNHCSDKQLALSDIETSINNWIRSQQTACQQEERKKLNECKLSPVFTVEFSGKESSNKKTLSAAQTAAKQDFLANSK